MRYLKKYSELFEFLNTPQPVDWKQKEEGIVGTFTCNDHLYHIYLWEPYKNTYKAYMEHPNIWEIAFSIIKKEEDKEIDSYTTTHFNQGRIEILSTVIEAFGYLIKLKNPNAIIFTAEDWDTGRLKTYKDLMVLASNKYGFNHYEITGMKGIAYILYKEETDKRNVADLIGLDSSFIFKKF